MICDYNDDYLIDLISIQLKTFKVTDKEIIDIGNILPEVKKATKSFISNLDPGNVLMILPFDQGINKNYFETLLSSLDCIYDLQIYVQVFQILHHHTFHSYHKAPS